MELDQLTWSTEVFPWEGRLRQILSSWEGTPYGERQCAKGASVDCIRFTCSVYDEMDGVSSRDHVQLPQDQALHSRETAITAMRAIRRLYMPNRIVRPGEPLEPADMLVMGYLGGGPGHAMIAGLDGFLFHTAKKVRRTGLITPNGMELVRVYRALNREQRWHR